MTTIRGLERRLAKSVARARSPIVGPVQRFFDGQLSRPVLLVGSARSGTTHLGSLLSAHPEIAGWSEANEVWDPEWYPWDESEPGRRWPLEFDVDEFVARWWDDARHRQPQIRTTFGAYAWARRRTVFLNKTPYNSYRIPHLEEVFSGTARYVELVRDGRAVAGSYARHLRPKMVEWPPASRIAFRSDPGELLVTAGRAWLAAIEAIDLARPMLSDRLLTVSYEDLCRSPGEVLSEVAEFVGIEPNGWDPNVIPAAAEPRNQRWESDWSVDDRQRLERAIATGLRSRGYTSADVDSTRAITGSERTRT